jgi:hypothetical protein
MKSQLAWDTQITTLIKELIYYTSASCGVLMEDN